MKYKRMVEIATGKLMSQKSTFVTRALASFLNFFDNHGLHHAY